MTPRFNELFFEMAQQNIQSEIQQAAQYDSNIITQENISGEDVKGASGLNGRLQEMQNQINNLNKIIKQQQKIQTKSGIGKNTQRMATAGGMTGAGITGKAAYNTIEEFQKTVQAFEKSFAQIQQYLKQFDQFKQSSLMEKINTAAEGLSGLLGGGKSAPSSNTNQPTNFPNVNVDMDSLLQNVDMAQFGLYVIAISAGVYWFGKLVQFIEVKYNQIKTNRNINNL
jgi:hypothetical protein